MSATYTAVTLDGQEHAGLDLETLKQWYCARRLRADSFVLSSEVGQWKLLKNLFDPSQWEAEQRAAGGSWMNDAAHETVPASQTYHQPSAQTTYPTPSQENDPNERDLGVRTAAIFLFINAALSIIALAFITSQNSTAYQGSGRWGLSILFDVAVGAKLLQSDNVKRWRRIAMVRVCLGALLIGTILMTLGGTDAARAMGLMQFVFASSFVFLLAGHSPSRARVGVGVLAFVISLTGILGIYFAGDLSGEAAAEKRDIQKYALPSRSFSDVASGGGVELPAGWVMLPAINPVTNIPEANMIAAHPESGSFAALLIVRNSKGPDLDGALSRVVDERKKSDPTVVEVERVNAQFGRLDGRKALLDWEYKGTKVKGAVAVAHSGAYYFVLLEWCRADTYPKSRQQFAALENGASAGEPAPDQFSQAH